MRLLKLTSLCNQMTSCHLLLPLILFLLLLLLLKAKNKFSKHNHKLPPGPWTLPIIGSLHHFIGFSLPHHVLHDLSRRFGDIMFLQIGEQPTVVISSRVAAREILKTHETTFCNRPLGPTAKVFTYGGTDLVFAPYGEYWRGMRKILTSELLSSKRVQSFRSIREEEVSKLIQLISSLSSCRQVVNLSEMVTLMANKVLLRAATGSKSRGDILFSSEIERSSELAAGFCLANLFPSSRLANLISTGALRKAEMCHRSIDKLTDRMIQEHRASEADGRANDLLSVLLRLHDEHSNKSISIDTVKAIIFDAVAGGTDRPGALLHWAMSELLKNPRVMKKAQDEVRRVLQNREIITEVDLVELNFIHLVVKETLRLHPLTPLMPRVCQETLNILDYNIPKGTTVLVNLWTIGRDSKYWKDAEEFKPERFAKNNKEGADSKGMDLEFFPFGAGRRICPGKSFGLAIVELTLVNLLYHFNWELPSGQKPDELDMTETFGVNVKRKFPLLLDALLIKAVR